MDQYWQTLEPYRDRPGRRGEVSPFFSTGSVSIGPFGVSRWRDGRGDLAMEFQCTVERVAALKSGSEFESGSLLRSRFVGLFGRPAVELAAHREVIPVILRLVLSEQFHEVTSKQPARKQLVCSAERTARNDNIVHQLDSDPNPVREHNANARTLQPWFSVAGSVFNNGAMVSRIDFWAQLSSPISHNYLQDDKCSRCRLFGMWKSSASRVYATCEGTYLSKVTSIAKT